MDEEEKPMEVNEESGSSDSSEDEDQVFSVLII